MPCGSRSYYVYHRDSVRIPGTQAAAPMALRDALALPKKPDLVCLSHLRWDFVYQRPHHLMSRFARQQRVYFVEEPVLEPGVAAHLTLSITAEGVFVAVPHLPEGISDDGRRAALEKLLGLLLHDSSAYVLWYYTPMALEFTRHLAPVSVVYDCMDELSAFRGAPKDIVEREAELLRVADVVFTGGHSLHEAKRQHHPNIHPFPSSVDVGHFRAARRLLGEPADQAAIGRPRIGFIGVIDERMDTALLDGVAAARPDWHLVILGPVVKIDPRELPRRPNIHYLGPKAYRELPRYLAGWDAAILPFAATSRRASSRPRRRPSTSPPAARSSRPRSATSCARTASRGSCVLPTRSRISSARPRPRSATAAARGGAAPSTPCSRRRPGTAHGPGWPRSSTRASRWPCGPARPRRGRRGCARAARPDDARLPGGWRESAWGYSQVETEEELAERLGELFAAVRGSELLAGFCYTQFADTYQESNGLLYSDRSPEGPARAHPPRGARVAGRRAHRHRADDHAARDAARDARAVTARASALRPRGHGGAGGREHDGRRLGPHREDRQRGGGRRGPRGRRRCG